MKIKMCVLALLLAAAVAPAQTNNLTALLQQGLLEEQGNRNLDAAIADYQSLSALFDKDRQLAATAVFRLGECYRAQGKTNEAAAQYERILREFPDQKTLATMSRQNLTGMGVSVASAAPPVSDAARQKQQQLLEEEIKVVEQEFQTQQAQFKLGVVSADTSLATEEKLLELKRQLVALEGGQAVSLPVATGADDEDHVIENIRQMIQNSPDLINADGGDPGGDPLNQAAIKGQLRVATFLLDHGANINPTHGETPLEMAAKTAQKTMIELLLSRGADVNAGGGAALLAAAQGGFQAVVEVLLAHKADVNLSDRNGNTPLCFAAQRGRVKIIQMLLAAGANPNVKINSGEPPLMFAAQGGATEAVKVLLAAGADPNAHSHNGMTPLTVAAGSGSLETVKLLLGAKADPNDSLLNGVSLLFSTMSRPDIFGALLDAGANVDAREKNDGSDHTPLIDAAQENLIPAVELLLKHGANPNARTSKGNTPLHVAAIATPPQNLLADRKIFELLLDHHADPNVQNNDGETPLILLERLKDNKAAAEIADLLRQHGALDKLPNWDRIDVNRLSANVPMTVFRKGAEDWNQFTLLETILNYYRPVGPDAIPKQYQQYHGMPFPDLSRVTIVRPSHGSTNETRIAINLLDSTNGIDCTKDVPLEFGDMVEIPPRDHPLGEPVVYLTESQHNAMFNYLKGNVQLVVRDQKVELPIYPINDQSTLGVVLGLKEAKQILQASSDLSRVKVTRRDAKTGEKREWIVDCGKIGENQTEWKPRMPTGARLLPPEPRALPERGGGIAARNTVLFDASQPASQPDLRLRDGDVIEVPEKP